MNLHALVSLKIHQALLLLTITTAFACCTSSNSTPLNVDQFAQQSPEDLLYFRDIAFRDDARIHRWPEDLRLQIEGTCMPEDSAEVRTAIQELKEMNINRPISLVAADGNILIRFTESVEEFKERWKDPEAGTPRGFAEPRYSFSGDLSFVNISVNEYLRGRERYTTLRHEICHSMGLGGHSKTQYKKEHLLGITSYGSIAEVEEDLKIKVARFPEADKKAIQLLYSDAIPNHTSLAQFDVVLKQKGLP